MSNEQHEVSYASNGILRGIHDLPEAAELALDELRRDPLKTEDQEHLNELQQRYGSEVSSFFIFFGKVINDTKAFVEIDFDPIVDEVFAADQSQERVVEELYAKYRTNYGQDEMPPEKIVALSNRANLLRAVATLAIKIRIDTKPAHPLKETQYLRSQANARSIALPN